MSEQSKMQQSVNGKIVAQNLIPGDQISINLAASKPDGARMSVAALFNHLGEAVDVKGTAIPGQAGLDLTLLHGAAAPEFPMAKYNELVEQGSIEAAEDLKAAYEIDLQNFEEEGGQSLPDSLAAAALDWADRVHGVKTQDTGDHPVIKPEQIVVKNVIRSTPDEAGLFTIQLTPTWG